LAVGVLEVIAKLVQYDFIFTDSLLLA